MVRIALVGKDLLLASSVEAVARDTGGEFAMYGNPAVAVGDYIFIDLNWDEAVDAVAVVRANQPEAVIVGFCGHEAKDLRRHAMQAGASVCVTNGSLVATARRIMGGQPVPRW